jgi:Tol biopolymer transport system component
MRRAIVTLLAAAGLAAALSPGAAALPAGSTTLIDRPAGFGALPSDGRGASRVNGNSLSFDSCFVVFESTADDLLATDDNSATNIYRQNRCLQGTPVVQVNATAAGEPAAAGTTSEVPSVSADGRYVAFSTDAPNLHPAAGPGRPQVLVKDMNTGALTLASRADGAGGAPADGSGPGMISGNGQVVAFRAYGPFDADNVDGRPQATSLYLRDLAGERTHMASVASNGVAGMTSREFDLSYSGREVAFVTDTQLAPGDSDAAPDAYVRNGIGTAGEATRLVTAAGDSAMQVAISGDGTRVAFVNDHAWIAACAPACGGATRLDQPKPNGSNADVDVAPYFAETMGSLPIRVYWYTRSPLDPQDTNGATDVYGAPIGGGEAALAGGNQHLTSGVVAGASTDNASVVVFSTFSNNVPGGGVNAQLYQLSGGQIRNLAEIAGLPGTADGAAEARIARLHATSDDGRIVAFTSRAAALGAPPKPGTGRIGQVFARDVASGATTLVSVGFDGKPQNAEGDSGDPEFSVDAAGASVAFTSRATNLVDVATGGKLHVYVRDLRTGTTRLVDRAPNGLPAEGGARRPVISGDGRRVAFVSGSPDLPGGGQRDHVYVADLVTGTVELVDRAPDGNPANASAGEHDLSFDGTRVAFASAATNLGAAGTRTHVYVRDLRAGTTTLASAPRDPRSVDEYQPALSGDGTRLAYIEEGLDSERLVTVRDLATGALFAAGGDDAYNVSLSRDGTTVAFEQGARAFVRNLSEPAASRADVRDGASAPGRLQARDVSISGSGGCVAFTSNSDDLVSPSYGPDRLHAFLRTLRDDCRPLPGGPAGPAAGDATAPAISRARVTPKRFAVGARRTPRSAARRKAKKGGTTFAFTLSEAAGTRIAIARKLPGRRAKRGRCVKPRRGLKRRCTRHVDVLTLTRSKTKRGANRVAFSGRVGRKKLKPGAYRATLVATDSAGNRSKPKRLTFRVVRR